MAMTFEDFVAETGAEVCGDRLIVGQGPDRRFVGDIEDGIFNLNAEGKDMQAEIESGIHGGAEIEEAVKKTRAKRTVSVKESVLDI